MHFAQSHSRGRSVIASLALAGLVATTAAGSVSADTELGHTGQVGAHSLRDGDIYHPGATCRYKTLAGGRYAWQGKLTRLDVRPPRMRSIGSSQRVGWRFIVQRAKGDGPWAVTYRSPVQKSRAYSTTNASFDPMTTAVAVPSDYADETYVYRVLVRMLWYRADGSVQGTARHAVNHYATLTDGQSDGGERDICYGWMAWVGH